MRGATALLLFAALSCHPPAASPPSVAPPPAPLSTRASDAAKTPLDALAEEARQRDLVLLVTRGPKVVIERRASWADALPSRVLGYHLTDVGLSNERLEHEVYTPLHIGANDHASVHMSLEAAERIARAALGGGVIDGTRVLPEDVAARIAGNRRSDMPFSWQEIGEGELAIITRPVFDTWRGVPSIDRATLAAVEPLVGAPIRIDDFVRVLEARLGKRSDDFRNELAKARKTMFERRWEAVVGFGLFDDRDAVVVLPRTNLVAVYAAKTDRYGMRSFVPFLRALE